jgi:hypothetical protein
MNTIISLLSAWFGEEEYHGAWHKQAQTRSFAFRFWDRLILSFVGLCFFVWQQIIEPSPWWGSDAFATLVLALTASQALGPLFYLLWRVTKRAFITEHYLKTLRGGRFYVSVKSALWIVLMAILSILAASGFIDIRWYIKLLVFFLTIPVASFWVLIPAFNWLGVRVRRLSA